MGFSSFYKSTAVFSLDLARVMSRRSLISLESWIVILFPFSDLQCGLSIFCGRAKNLLLTRPVVGFADLKAEDKIWRLSNPYPRVIASGHRESYCIIGKALED